MKLANEVNKILEPSIEEGVKKVKIKDKIHTDSKGFVEIYDIWLERDSRGNSEVKIQYRYEDGDDKGVETETFSKDIFK
jgi:hypothetical protein